MIGVMSDSHDNVTMIRKAVALFKDAGCDLVLHAGDIIAPFAARELEALGCPIKAVFGNCDGEKPGLEKTLEGYGEIKEAPFIFVHSGRKFLLVHYHFSVGKYAASGNYDVIIFGHTHKPELKRGGKTLALNPGEAGGWLTGKCTVALLDTEKLEAEILSL
ncbi:MAG: metallophosphoesterase [Candidatus Aminicenantes bacterium]|nr:metallophosphoesterase [Candidatus Aminicenantes bacterium]